MKIKLDITDKKKEREREIKLVNVKMFGKNPFKIRKQEKEAESEKNLKKKHQKIRERLM